MLHQVAWGKSRAQQMNRCFFSRIPLISKRFFIYTHSTHRVFSKKGLSSCLVIVDETARNANHSTPLQTKVSAVPVADPKAATRIFSVEIARFVCALNATGSPSVHTVPAFPAANWIKSSLKTQLPRSICTNCWPNKPQYGYTNPSWTGVVTHAYRTEMHSAPGNLAKSLQSTNGHTTLSHRRPLPRSRDKQHLC